MWWKSYSVLLFILYTKGLFCLRMVSLKIPTLILEGETAKLTCDYDLEGDRLYSVKWYRDDVEFFRFIPRDKPQGQFFALHGIHVDLLRLGNSTLYLEDTDSTTSGIYRCEVSADAPSFQTVSAQRRVVVSEILKSRATRRGLRFSILAVAVILLGIFLL